MQGTALETRGEVTATAYDASGTRMVTSTAEGAVHVWDREDDLDEATEGAPGPWRQTAAWAAHDDVSCEAIAFAPAEFGQCVATAAADGSVRVWREKPLAPLGAEPAVATEAAAAAAAAAREGRRAVGTRRRSARARAPTTLLDFAPPEHGLRLAAAGADGVVRFYAPGNTLALLGWGPRTKPRRSSPARRFRRWRGGGPPPPRGARAESAGDVSAHRGSLPAALAVALVWHADALGDGAKCDARVLTYDEGIAGVGAPRRFCLRRARARRRPALAWAPNADASPAGAAETRGGARLGGGGVPRGALRAEDRAEDPPRNETARLRRDSLSEKNASASSTPSATNARLCASLSHPGPVYDLDWNTVGTTLATSAADGVVRVWAANMQTGAWETRARLVGEEGKLSESFERESQFHSAKRFH